MRECRRHGRRPATAGTATGPGHGSGAGTGGRRLARAVRPTDATPGRCLSTGDPARDLAPPRSAPFRRDRPDQLRLLAPRRGHDRSRRGGGCRRSRVLGRGPHLAQRRRPVSPDRPVPAVRLRPVDAAAVRAVGAAAVGRGLGRLARRDDPVAAVDRRLGLSPPPADDRADHRAPRVPGRSQPRHREHQPPADADALGRAVQRAAARRCAVGAGHVDEVGAGDRAGRSCRARHVAGDWSGSPCRSGSASCCCR